MTHNFYFYFLFIFPSMIFLSVNLVYYWYILIYHGSWLTFIIDTIRAKKMSELEKGVNNEFNRLSTWLSLLSKWWRSYIKKIKLQTTSFPFRQRQNDIEAIKGICHYYHHHHYHTHQHKFIQTIYNKNTGGRSKRIRCQKKIGVYKTG